MLILAKLTSIFPRNWIELHESSVIHFFLVYIFLHMCFFALLIVSATFTVKIILRHFFGPCYFGGEIVDREDHPYPKIHQWTLLQCFF